MLVKYDTKSEEPYPILLVQGQPLHLCVTDYRALVAS